MDGAEAGGGGSRGTQITIKSGPEEASMALKRVVAARRPVITSLIESTTRVSKTSPKVERTIRKWRNQFRKVKLHEVQYRREDRE